MDTGQWLVEHRIDMDRAEARWLDRLAEFDDAQLWALDGQLSCTSWLVWRTKMARSTAFEKLRVAHELRRRPVVADAYREGRLSYSAVRAITRVERPDPEVDEALVELGQSAEVGIVDLERVARSYRLYADQERPLRDEDHQIRDVRIHRDEEGTGQIVVTLGDVEVEEFASALQAFLDIRYRRRPVDESSAEDGSVAVEAPLEEPDRAAKKADAFMDLVRTAVAHADGGQAVGADRYLVHLVVHHDRQAMTTLDGRPLRRGDAAMLRCDCSTATHDVGSEGELLRLGRKTREWSTAQRRAIAVRDGGHCRFVGCDHRLYDIHHIQPWENGGATDVGNGICQCRRHHRMLHHGYRSDGDADHELRFYRPDGTYIGSTYPATGV